MEVYDDRKGLMYREYRLKNISDWYSELLAAVEDFTADTLQTPKGVGYSSRVYRQINIIVNREKDRIHNDAGENPDEDDFIEIGSVADSPDGEGEPLDIGSRWRKAS